MDFWDIEKQVTRGHAYFAERTIRTIKEAMLRRVAAGAGRRGHAAGAGMQWPTRRPIPRARDACPTSAGNARCVVGAARLYRS